MITGKLELTPKEHADMQLSEVREKINEILVTTLKAFGCALFHVTTKFNREWFRMDITINEREYQISIQGKGGEIKEYHEKILEIINQELGFKK